MMDCDPSDPGVIQVTQVWLMMDCDPGDPGVIPDGLWARWPKCDFCWDKYKSLTASDRRPVKIASTLYINSHLTGPRMAMKCLLKKAEINYKAQQQHTWLDERNWQTFDDLPLSIIKLLVTGQQIEQAELLAAPQFITSKITHIKDVVQCISKQRDTLACSTCSSVIKILYLKILFGWKMCNKPAAEYGIIVKQNRQSPQVTKVRQYAPACTLVKVLSLLI